MITASTPRSVSRACDVSIRYSDSGVVMRMSGGWRTSCRRSSARVSPVRMPTVGSVNGDAEPLGREADARERRPQVLLDVEGERPQRRDVEQPRAARPCVGHRRGARAGRCPTGTRPASCPPGGRQDQRVLAGRDRPPALGLRRRRLGEGAGEPRPHRGREARQRGRRAARPRRSHLVEATALDPSSTRSR